MARWPTKNYTKGWKRLTKNNSPREGKPTLRKTKDFSYSKKPKENCGTQAQQKIKTGYWKTGVHGCGLRGTNWLSGLHRNIVTLEAGSRQIGTSADLRWTGSLYGERRTHRNTWNRYGNQIEPIMTQTGKRAARETTLNFNQTQLAHWD